MLTSEQISNIKDGGFDNHDQIIKLKNAFVGLHMYEDASQVRDIELVLFPESKEFQEERRIANEISEKSELLLRMVGINSDKKSAYLVYKVMELFRKKKDKLTTSDTENIKKNAKKLLD